MADKGYSSVQLLDDNDDESDEELLTTGPHADDLKFQEFTSSLLPDSIEQLRNSANFDNTQGNESDGDDIDDDDEKELLSNEKKSPSFWTFEYYQSFFDVDTDQVMSRILYSMFPRKQNYLLTKIRPTPDYYGPFWVCTTLVFTIAICGNLSSFFASEGATKWKSNFQLVSLSAGVIFAYAWVVPCALWGFLTWRGNIAGFTFFETICVYGYSLSVFIPISILWVIPFDWLRWILVLVGVSASGSVLAFTFWRAVEDDNRKTAVLTMCMVILLHAALAIGFKLYFFKTLNIHQVYHELATTITTTTLSTTSTNTTKGG